jgi:hypothetical protein
LKVPPRSIGVILLAALAVISLCVSSGQAVHGSDDGGGSRGIPPPELEGPWYLDDRTLDSIGTGNKLLFRALVADASGVANVTVEHWRGKEWPHGEDPLDLVSGNSTEGLWEVCIQVSPDSLESIRYRFHAVDIHGNKNWTSEKAI